MKCTEILPDQEPLYFGIMSGLLGLHSPQVCKRGGNLWFWIQQFAGFKIRNYFHLRYEIPVQSRLRHPTHRQALEVEAHHHVSGMKCAMEIGRYFLPASANTRKLFEELVRISIPSSCNSGIVLQLWFEVAFCVRRIDADPQLILVARHLSSFCCGDWTVWVR